MHSSRSVQISPEARVRQRGFTMLELAIVLVVFAILVAIAYPAYNRQVIKSRRADGRVMLFTAAQRQQQFFTENGAFTATIGDGGLGLATTSGQGYYTLSVVADASSYTLTATRVSAQTADVWCGNLTLTHLGVKGINCSGSDCLPAAQCW